MKKLTVIAIGCLLTLNLALADNPSTANQKWLTVVESMVAEGHTTVSTPSKDRIDLLKDWAKKKGYSVEVTQKDKSYRATLSKPVAKN